MRGKARCAVEDICDRGITPAYAGKSDDYSFALWSAQDHPLHMRGKAFATSMIKYAVRITPAYAGKSNAGTAYQSSRQDHPCICGEKYGDHNGGRDIMGSPLHMRGKVFISKLNSNINRITPAYAGKRLRDKDGKIYLEDHPCICGEKISGLSLAEMERGSPLHMRGKGYP